MSLQGRLGVKCEQVWCNGTMYNLASSLWLLSAPEGVKCVLLWRCLVESNSVKSDCRIVLILIIYVTQACQSNEKSGTVIITNSMSNSFYDDNHGNCTIKLFLYMTVQIIIQQLSSKINLCCSQIVDINK